MTHPSWVPLGHKSYLNWVANVQCPVWAPVEESFAISHFRGGSFPCGQPYLHIVGLEQDRSVHWDDIEAEKVTEIPWAYHNKDSFLTQASLSQGDPLE